MHRPRRPRVRIGTFLFVALALRLCACDLPTPDSQPGTDASRWFDVSLPAYSVPDAFILTQLAADGTTMVVNPTTSTCGDADTLDAADAADATLADDIVASFDATPALTDAGVVDGSGDAIASAPPANACPVPVAPGDLVFDEVMIATEPGSEDRGQWLEVRSLRTCALNLLGIHAAAPHGESFRTMDVTTDVWLPPDGFFLIADTTDPTENHALPGLVFAWAGSPADALHKTSDTVTLSVGASGPIIDTLSYPNKKRTEGTSMAFPSRCAASLRADFTNWQPSVASWTPGLMGTPNAPNLDVTCGVPPIPRCTPAGRRLR